MPEINWLGALVAGVAGFILGAMWYSPLLFSKRWQSETGVGTTKPIRYPFALPMLFSVTSAIVGAIVLSVLIGPLGTVTTGALFGAAIGFLCIAPAIAMNGLFGQDSPALIAIHALYPALQFALMGVMIALMS